MYKLARNTVRVPLKLLYGLRVFGEENVPATGGAVLASTHVSYIDPVAVACAIQRPIHFMAKAELFRYPIIGGLFHRVNAFPVRRGMADRSAIRTGIEVVQAGNLLGIFPEGTRARGEELLPIQGGAAMIAMKTGVPVIPIAVRGVKELKLRHPVEVIIGSPLDFSGPRKVSKPELVEASEEISQQFTALLRRKLP